MGILNRKKEDLGVKIVSKEKALWQTMYDRTKIAVEQLQNELLVQKELLIFFEIKAKEAK